MNVRYHMNLGIRAFLLALPSLLWTGPAHAAPMTVKDLLAVRWISQVALHPSGREVVFVQKTADIDANKSTGHIFRVPIDDPSPSPRQLTAGPGGESQPAFSPDGKTLAFVSSRSGGTPQIFLLPVDGGEARQLTHLSTGAWGPVWSSDSQQIAFVSQVFPACNAKAHDEPCNKRALEAQEKSLVKAKVIDHLLFRHWNAWRDESRQHIFVQAVSGGEPRDLTPGPHDAPPIALGGEPDYAFSPDGKTLAYTSNTDAVLATSTNNDVFEVPVAGGKPVRVSQSPGNDNSPRYSPDGRYLSFLSMERAGYESDRPRILVLDRKSRTVVEWTRGYDGAPAEYLWSPTSDAVFFTAPHLGYQEVFRADAQGVKQVSRKLYLRYLNVSSDGKTLCATHEAADRPPEVVALSSDGSNVRPLTKQNTDLIKKLKLQPAEHHWYIGANGDRIHATLVKPPGFKTGARYPALVMLHGGPQGMTGDSFHPRWNLAMFAARGYVVFGPNFHGSVGFGQAFCDSIRGDWGGKPYEDVQKGTEYLASLPFIKGTQVCTAGASYGGYLTNWIATHTTRYRCIITHAGLFNMESKYGSTEELWFPEWDMMGTPWGNREGYRKLSPHSFAENIKTPTLVVHGQNDFRVPVEQGFQMFTALQRQGIPSRLLWFPDEDHFVQKPQNIQLWWATMFDWLGRYLK